MPGDQIPHSTLPTAEIGTAQFNSAMKELAVETQQAVYFFFVYTEENLAHVTKIIRKGGEGYDQSTSLTVEGARKLYKQLLTR